MESLLFKFDQCEWMNNKKQIEENGSCKIDYSMGGELNERIEKDEGLRLILSGPLVDFYLAEIGKHMLQKLTRSKLTGPSSFTINIPTTIMKRIHGLFMQYGAEFHYISGKKRIPTRRWW